MKLLIISQAGMHLYCQRIFSELARCPGVDLTVIVPELFYPHHVGTGNALALEKAVERDGYLMVPVPLRNPHKYTAGFRFRALARAIRRVNPDITHVWDEARSVFLLQAVWAHIRCGLKAKILFYAFENIPFRFKPFFDPFWRLSWSRVAGGTASNSEALENLRSLGLLENRFCERIFWGTALDLFKPLGKAGVRGELRLDFPYIVGAVGGLLPQKGFGTLLEAVARMPVDVHCVLIGAGPMRGELEQRGEMADLHGRVHIIDQVPSEKMSTCLNCFDVLVIPSLTTVSWKEQFGKVIPEAMACGVPVIGSDSGAIPEVIGDAGLVFPEGDAEALAHGLMELYGHPEKSRELSRRGVERARKELSAAAFALKHVAFYDRLLHS